VPTPKEEALWALRAQCGDEEALEQLLRSVSPALRRYLSGLVGEADADDVHQDALVIVARKIAWLERPDHLRAWAFRVASRLAFRRLKIRRREIQQAVEMELDDIPAQRTKPASDLLPELLALKAISPASRAVLVLHFQEEMSLPEVAAILDIPLGTVKSRLAYGLAALRKHLNIDGRT